VKLINMNSKPELNDTFGTLKKLDEKSGQWKVFVHYLDDKVMLIKPHEKMVLLPESEQPKKD